MNYSADRPINTKQEDLLGRKSFSNQLGKAIYEYDAKDGLVIGLFGKWGTGKTSVINMAENEIKQLAVNDENKPFFIRFSPWNYSDKNNLISLFFQKLKIEIKSRGNKEINKKLGKVLNDYSVLLEGLSLIPAIGSILTTIVKSLTKTYAKKLMQDVDLDKTKENLENELKKANKKIIIVIDDIDRLNNSQIRDIFQLVKQVADFPNLIYVLVMDREVVCSALSEIHNINGDEYLEKIIQVPFELPEIRKTKLYDIFNAKLEQVLKDLSIDIIPEKDYGYLIFSNFIKPYVHTLRDINRLINTFQFRYGLLHQETSLEDMLAITTLEIFEPNLYRWICNNKDAVLGSFLHGLMPKSDYHKFYTDEFKQLKINPERALTCVSTLFPVFAKDINKSQFLYQSSLDNKRKMRVADAERFELYFMLDLDNIKIPRNLTLNCILHSSEDELLNVINKINLQGNISYFFTEVKSLKDVIPYTRVGLLSSVILNFPNKFFCESSKSLFNLSAINTAEYLVMDLLTILNTEKERYEIINNALIYSKISNLGTIASLIHKIKLSFEILDGESNYIDKPFINIEQFKNLEKTYSSKIYDFSTNESFLEMNNFYISFYLWKCIDSNNAKNYLETIFKSEICKLKFICLLAHEWTGTNGNGWSFKSSYYSEFISKEEVYRSIQNFDKIKLKMFTETEQIILASFVLEYFDSSSNYIYEQSALKLVEEWKSNNQ